ncbi:zinc-ribbon domain-containing protein [Leifsonia shinshuensis]|uniref:Treble clef zinc finger domain-containing protein n=1 Tax=Leifsonia shinshuensis TaxID=150026 RepID=A0A7G6YAA8_9MICO|nr:zinc-ribbon domain-containing protein [Leifsonia shinshuensis]QNE35423.1 hypothetical protein F1C12_09970 [Leifsonia shinshuensis]
MQHDTFTRRLRPYIFPVRPRHLETFASFESRITAANFENRSHRHIILKELRPELPGRLPAELWKEIVVARARLRLDHFAVSDAVELSHSDGSVCNGCRVGVGEQWMCRLCAHGAEVKLRPHLEQLVCTRHRLWVGSGTRPADQFTVSDEYLAAERTFQKLRRKGWASAATLWELVHVIDPTLADEAEHHIMPPQPFPAAMRLWAVLATVDFQRSFFDPCQTYAEAFEYLREVLGGLGDAGLVRRVWHYLRPTALTIREWVLAGGEFRPHWEHDFRINPVVVTMWKIPMRPLEPFHRYLAASDVTEVTAENWREVLTHRNPGHALKFFHARAALPAICVNGHRISMSALKGVGTRTNFQCAYCTRRIAVPGETDITMTHPERASWFDQDANGTASPTEYVSTSARKLAWVCPEGHKYTRSVAAQCTSKRPCTVCFNWDFDPDVNSVAVKAPQLVAEWHPTLNDRTPREVKACTTEYAWFQCTNGHPPYRGNIGARMNGTKCRVCSLETGVMKRAQRIAEVRPELEAEWDPALNDGLAFADLLGSVRQIRTWRCTNGHLTYKSTYRRLQAGCGYCSGHNSSADSNAVTRFPLIMSEFDEVENRIPAAKARVDAKYFWRCEANGHLTVSKLHNRRLTRGCARCPKDLRIANGLEKGTF